MYVTRNPFPSPTRMLELRAHGTSVVRSLPRWSSLLVGVIALAIAAVVWLAQPDDATAAQKEPQITDLRFSPTDNGQVRINYRIKDVQDGADIEVYVHWRDSGSTFSQVLAAFCLESDADFESFWGIPASLASARQLELGLQVTGRFWPDDDSGPSWFDQAFGVQQANAAAVVAGAGVVFAGRIAWGVVAKALATAVITVTTVTTLPPEWDGWNRQEKGRWGETEARRMLEECGWDILAKNEVEPPRGRPVTEQDLRVKKHKFWARDPNALVGVRPRNNVSKSQITDLVLKAEKFRFARGNVDSYMLAVYRGTPAHSISTIKSNLIGELSKTGFKRGYLMDMATGCPVEIWKR